MSNPWRKEPRQPQKHRGIVVHTEKSKDYDDNITQQGIDAMLSEARASVALDGETQSVEGVSLPRTTVPSVASDPDKREEPIMSSNGKRTALPGGQQGDDVVHAITTYCEVGQVFTPDKVWATLGQRKQGEWIKAYGGRDNAFRKVKVALNNLNYSGRLGIERIGPQMFRYTGKKGTPSAAYTRNVSTKEVKARNDKRRAKDTKVPVDKSDSKPATVVKATRATEHEGFRNIGVDYEGRPLYIERSTNSVGHVKVIVQFVAV